MEKKICNCGASRDLLGQICDLQNYGGTCHRCGERVENKRAFGVYVGEGMSQDKKLHHAFVPTEPFVCKNCWAVMTIVYVLCPNPIVAQENQETA